MHKCSGTFDLDAALGAKEPLVFAVVEEPFGTYYVIALADSLTASFVICGVLDFSAIPSGLISRSVSQEDVHQIKKNFQLENHVI